MSERKPQSFRADPIFLANLRQRASQYGLSMSDLVVRYLKVAYKLHQKYPDILGLGAQIDLDDIPDDEIRYSASQALFSGEEVQKDSGAVELLRSHENYEALKESIEEQKKAFQETIEKEKRSLEEQKQSLQAAIETSLQEAFDSQLTKLIDERVRKRLLNP